MAAVLSEGTKLLAPGEMITLVNQETGQPKVVRLRYNSRALHHLEEQYGSLAEAARIIQGLAVATKPPEWHEVWRIVQEHEAPQDYIAKYENEAVASHVLASMLEDYRPYKRMAELSRCLAAGLNRYDSELNELPAESRSSGTITPDQLLDWIPSKQYNDLMIAVIAAFLQALPDKEDDGEGESQGNAPTAPLPGAESSTLSQSAMGAQS